MSGFNSSEMGDMISRKKYEVKRGDTLSELAAKFQESFPSVKEMNQHALMEAIYTGSRESFGGSKDLLLEGRDLDLTFVADSRSNFRFDTSRKEYVFTDEDRLVFALKGDFYFWDDFIRADREIGEYMKQSFRDMPSFSLPQSMALPMGSASFYGGRSRVMEEVKKMVSEAMVTTEQIVEAFFKLMGTPHSSGSVREWAEKLERENGVRRHSPNRPCCAPREKLEQVNCKCLEECYLAAPLSPSAAEGLERGFYEVTDMDKVFFAENADLFWRRLYQDSSDKAVNEEARKGAGLSMAALEGNKIFVATRLGRDNISLIFRENVRKVIPTEGENRIKILYLYCNYMGSNFSKIDITSTFRTPEEQVIIMMRDYLPYPNQTLYTGYSKDLYDKAMNDTKLTIEQRKKKAYDDLLANVNRQKNTENIPGFPHCNPNICATDTASYDNNVMQAIIKFRNAGIYLKHNSLYFAERSEKANHLILTGLHPTSTV